MLSERNPPEVLFLLALNQSGGAEKSLLAIAEGLQASGMKVGLAVYGARKDLITSHKTGCTVYLLPAKTTLRALFPLIKLLRNLRPPVLITALRHPNVMALLAARLAGTATRVIITEHSPLSAGFAALRNWKHQAMHSALAHFYDRADAVVAVSAGIAEDIRRQMQSPDKVSVIYNPIVADAERGDYGAAPHDWLNGSVIPVVITVGRLSAEKDMATLLHACALARATCKLHLIILGDGPEREALEALSRELGIAQDVFFAGYVPDTALWVSRASVFVSPSRFEGFGNAIVEAMACNVPVIATDCPVGPAEILEQGKHGALVPVGDDEIMAKTILEALANPPATDSARLRAQDFTVSKCIAGYGKLIGKLAKRPPALSFRQRAITRFQSIFLYEHWNVGIIHAPIESAPIWKECPPVTWLGASAGSYYLADPFSLPGDENSFLCERFDLSSKKGSISRITVNNPTSLTESHVPFEIAGHLSYPFTFTHEGTAFCMPESGMARCLNIYRERGDHTWELVATPLTDTAAADSVLFTHEGRFWIGYTDMDINPFGNFNLLYAYNLEGPWAPHEHNPVQTGMRVSRCGGTPFRVGDLLYRPAQDCSRVYGGALSIMRIIECTPGSYLEKEVNHILPKSGFNSHGLHTLSAWGERCLVDGKHLRFSLLHVGRKLGKRITKLLHA